MSYVEKKSGSICYATVVDHKQKLSILNQQFFADFPEDFENDLLRINEMLLLYTPLLSQRLLAKATDSDFHSLATFQLYLTVGSLK